MVKSHWDHSSLQFESPALDVAIAPLRLYGVSQWWYLSVWTQRTHGTDSSGSQHQDPNFSCLPVLSLAQGALALTFSLVAIFHVGPFCDRVLMLTTSVQKRSSDFGIRDKMTVLIWIMLLHCVITRREAWELTSADSFSSFLEVSCPLGQSWHMNSTSRYNWCHTKPVLAGPRGK